MAKKVKKQTAKPVVAVKEPPAHDDALPGKSAPAIPSKAVAVKTKGVMLSPEAFAAGQKKLADLQHLLDLTRAEDTAQLNSLKAQVADLTKQLGESIAAKAPEKVATEELAKFSELLMAMPADSQVRAKLYALMDALVADKHAGGAPGKAVVELLDAAGNPADPAYNALGVMERSAAVAMASALKAAFQ